MSDHDLDWVATQRPQSGPDREAHDRALLALLRHASSRPGSARDRGRRLPGLVKPRSVALPAGLGVAGIAAVVAIVAVSTGGNGNGLQAHRQPVSTLHAAVHHAGVKSPLVRLADYVSASATPPGDATLIQRTTHTGGQDVTVYDLYGDNGTYYFSRAESGLPAQVSGGDNQGAGVFRREVAAAKEAASGNVQQGALDMANAPAPNGPYRITRATENTQPPAVTAAARLKAKLSGVPADPVSSFDNWAWENSQDAIIAGAGDPQVRAGVLQILAMLPGVSVTHGTTSDGQPTLVLTGGADEVGSGYQEQLTINADTGMPIEFVGGAPNGSASTQVDYRVARVTLTNVAAGQLPAF